MASGTKIDGDKTHDGIYDERTIQVFDKKKNLIYESWGRMQNSY